MNLIAHLMQELVFVTGSRTPLEKSIYRSLGKANKAIYGTAFLVDAYKIDYHKAITEAVADLEAYSGGRFAPFFRERLAALQTRAEPLLFS